MPSHTLRVALGGVAVAALASAANASIIDTFIGYSPTQTPSGSYVTERAAFLASGPSAVESFEDQALGAFPGTLEFGSSVEAAFTNDNAPSEWRAVPRVLDEDPESQNTRTPTDGERFLYLGVNPGDAPELGLDFDPTNIVRGFGFSITDLGDFGAEIRITLANGHSDTVTIAPNQNDLPEAFANGSRIWVSFITDVAIDSLTIDLGNATAGDNFSFDEFTVLIPVPPAFAMAGVGLAAVAWRRRKMAQA